jgi:Flp pilus assembly protein TadG
MRRRRRTDLRAERGQAAVEFALIAPVFIALMLAIVQFGIALNNYLTVTDAARAGARSAAVDRISGNGPADATAAVDKAASALDPAKLGVTVTCPDWTTPGSDVTVTVTYPFSISILGWVVHSGTLSSTQTERLE